MRQTNEGAERIIDKEELKVAREVGRWVTIRGAIAAFLFTTVMLVGA